LVDHHGSLLDLPARGPSVFPRIPRTHGRPEQFVFVALVRSELASNKVTPMHNQDVVIPLLGQRNEEFQFGLNVTFQGWTLDLDYFHDEIRKCFHHKNIGNSNPFCPSPSKVHAFAEARRRFDLHGSSSGVCRCTRPSRTSLPNPVERSMED
jgi:hypothetical protein